MFLRSSSHSDNCGNEHRKYRYQNCEKAWVCHALFKQMPANGYESSHGSKCRYHGHSRCEIHFIAIARAIVITVITANIAIQIVKKIELVIFDFLSL